MSKTKDNFLPWELQIILRRTMIVKMHIKLQGHLLSCEISLS